MDYLHACNEADASPCLASQCEAADRMADLASYILEFGECAEDVDKEDWK